jgi:peptidoglycan/LPS O-acetylase OafA/YrhL
MNYRREIDGLRAIAVLPVILFHAGFEAFSGGFVGVDVFFVISGYLITTIIINEKDAGTFSLRSFYERRARRILPALITVMLATAPLAWLWLPPENLRSFSESMAAVSLFLSNFYFWEEIDYFSAAAELQPLLHTWSLAVEEQYYLIAPLLIVLLWPLGLKRLGIVFSVIAIASLVAAEWWVLQDPAGAFFMLHTRAWELMAGALAALYLWRRQSPPLSGLPWLRTVLAVTGLGLIAAGVFLLDGDTPFPGRYALLPVVGTTLLILFAATAEPVGRLLGTRILVGIGLVSYSAYLWHQPLFALNRMRAVEAMGPLTAWGLIALTFGLATLSLYYIERPFRNRKRLTRRQIARSAVGASLLCIVIGGVGIELDGAPQRLSDFNRQLYRVSEEGNPTGGDCSSFNPANGIPVDDCVPEGDFDSRLLIIGDSHTNAFAHAFMDLQEGSDIGVTQLSRSACMTVPGLSRTGREDRCSRHSQAVDEFIRRDDRHDVVMFVVRWTLNLEGSRFNNREGGIEYGDSGAVRPVGSGPLTENERKRRVATVIQQQVNDYLELGKRVVLVYPVPEVGWHVPYRMMRKQDAEFPPGFASTAYEIFTERNSLALDILNGIDDRPNLARFRPHRALCDTRVADRCITQIDGVPLYKDDHHLSRTGGRLMAELLLPIVRGERQQGPTRERAENNLEMVPDWGRPREDN